MALEYFFHYIFYNLQMLQNVEYPILPLIKMLKQHAMWDGFPFYLYITGKAHLILIHL